MAFATSQNIDQLLTRGLSFRLPNNAPISSLYTLYANGVGQTYWSNSINPNDLSTLSVAIGIVGSTVAFQGLEIADLYGQVSTLSTGTAQNMSSLSNFLLDTLNSTITGISTFSTFYADLTLLSNETGAQFSSFSTLISVQNSTQSAFLTSTLTSSINGLVLSSSTGLARQISTISTNVVFFPTFYSTTNSLLQITLSTSSGLQTNINSNVVNLTAQINTLRNQFVSSDTVLFSTVAGYGPRIGSLEALSTNLSSINGIWISSQIGVSQSTQNANFNTQISTLSSFLSTVAINANAQFGSLSSISSALYSSILSNTSTNASQDAAISTLSRNLSILTTSSILANVYDTFIQLEAYTTNLINSTIDFTYYWQSSLFISTLNQSASISQAYFSTFTGTAFLSTVSAVTVLSEQYISTYVSTYTSQLFISSLSTINNLNSTTIGVNYSTGYSFLLSTLSVLPTPLTSTVVFIGCNAGRTQQGALAVAVGNASGCNNQGSESVSIGNLAGNNNAGVATVAIGSGAGQTSQGTSSISVGYNAGRTSQGASGVAVGVLAGQNSQSSGAVSVGAQAGRFSQGLSAVALGSNAGNSNQGACTIAIGANAGATNQHISSIILNATGADLNSDGARRLYIAPIRNDEAITGGFLHYNSTTNEIVYNAQGGSGGSGVVVSTFTQPIYVSSIETLGNLFINSQDSNLGFGAGANFATNVNPIVFNGLVNNRQRIASDAAGSFFALPFLTDSNGVSGGLLALATPTGFFAPSLYDGNGFIEVAVSSNGQTILAVINTTSQLEITYDGGANWSFTGASDAYTHVAMTPSAQYMAAVNASDQIYLSSDFGSNWTSAINLGFTHYTNIVMTDNGQTLYLGSHQLLYKSLNFGSNWAYIGTFFAEGFLTSIDMTGDGSVLLVCDEDNGVWRSLDSSSTFTNVLSGYQTYDNCALNRSTGQYMLVSDSVASTYRRSYDYGSNWQALPITVQDPGPIAINYRGFETCFVRNANQTGGPFSSNVFLTSNTEYVFTSYNIGINDTNPTFTLDISGSLFASTITTNNISNGDIINTSTSRSAVGTAVNLYAIETAKTVNYNNNYGFTYLKLVSTLGGGPDAEGRWGNGTAFSADGKYIYIGKGNGNNGTGNGYVYKSADYGNSFNQVGTTGQSNWNDLACTRDGSIVYAANGGNGSANTGQIYKSVDYGSTWTALTSVSPATWTTVVCSGDGKIVTALIGGTNNFIYVSTDYGGSFTTRHTSVVYAALATNINGQYITAVKAFGSTGISISSDYGNSWSNVTGATSSLEFVGAAMSASGQYQMAGGGLAIYYSSDYGASWTAASVSGVSADAFFININCDDSGQYVMAAFYDSSLPLTGGIVYSSNYGQSYSAVVTGDYYVAAGISPNSQYSIILQRPSIFRNFVPTDFPAGITTTSSIATAGRFNMLNVSTIGGFSPITFTDSLIVNGALTVSTIVSSGPTNTSSMNVSSITTRAINYTANSVKLGVSAGQVSQGASAIAIGLNAGSNTQGAGAISIGANAGISSQGTLSIALGSNAGNTSQSAGSVAIGFQAGCNSQGINAIAIGSNAGQVLQTQNAVSIGLRAGQTNQGLNSVAIGTQVGTNYQSSYSVSIGAFAGESNQNSYSIALGYLAGRNVQGLGSIAIGCNAGCNSQSAAGLAIGINAGRTNQGINSIAIGPAAGLHFQSTASVALGRDAGYCNQNSNAIAIGEKAGFVNQGAYAIGIGYAAGSNAQNASSIVINARASALNAAASGFFVNPVRPINTVSNTIMQYNTATNEIVYNNTNLVFTSSLVLGPITANYNMTDFYRYLAMSGGNATGFIFGAYDGLGSRDGLQISYNYLNTNTSDVIVSAGGATSRIEVGYGAINLFTGRINTAPSTLRMSVGHNEGTNSTLIGINTISPSFTLDVIGQTSISGSNTGVFTRIINTSLTGPALTGFGNDWNSVLGLGGISNATAARSWDIGIETTSSSGLALGFFSYSTSNFTGTRILRGYLATSSSNGPLNFTGQHRCFPADDLIYPLSSNIGKIVVATGRYQNMPLDGSLIRGISSITISESLPLVSLTSKIKDKRCFGVICDVEDFNNRSGNNGNFVTPYQKTIGDTRIFVNSIGEGAIWICDANGPVENGDYITSSDIPGYGMKQNEEYIANYTVAKVTMDCDFNSVPKLAQIPLTSTINGKTEYVLDSFSTIIWITTSNLEPPYQFRYLNSAGEDITKAQYDTLISAGSNAFRAAFLGCTYHCG